jgi:hypothetical protein
MSRHTWKPLLLRGRPWIGCECELKGLTRSIFGVILLPLYTLDK